MCNVQSPVIDDGKRIGKRREARVYNAPLQRTAPLDIKKRSKIFGKKFNFIESGVTEYPDSGTFSVFRPGGTERFE